MTDDPVRLLDEASSDLLRSLISAGREEEPDHAAVRRTLAAVGVAAALTTATASASGAAGSASAVGASGASGMAGTVAIGSAKGAASSTLIVVVKWLAIGAVAGTVASSAVYGVSGVLTPPPRVVSSAPQPLNTVPAPANLPRVPTAINLPEIPPPPAIVTPPPQVAEPAASQRTAALGAPLAAEVAALDSARQALGSGDAARTLELLSGYETRFAEARMLPEALYLRLEAFTLKGDKSNAEAVARRILRVYPSSPHAARARAVLGLDK